MTKKQRLKIIQDPHPTSPREDGGIGTMVTWHPSYTLGEEQPTEDPDEWLKDLPEKTAILPLYLYDHSGISIRCAPFSCRWDSGQVGWIWVPLDFSWDEGKTTYTEEELYKVLEAEVGVYDQYLRGHMWGYEILESDTCKTCNHTEEEVVDSCWGFIGEDVEETGIKDHLPDEIQDQLDDAWENREWVS